MPQFGRYTLLRPVGTGGMAEIWKAKVTGPEGFQKTLAIKKILPHLVKDKVFLQMFIEEAKLVAGLVHPNVVQVFDFGEAAPQQYFIAMEYVAGTNLGDIMRRLNEQGARLPAALALYIIGEACRGLGYAHELTDEGGTPLRIVHRDVSPQNILVSFGGEVKITDFGIAKIESAISHTVEGQVRGKLAYMSPEQAAGKVVDARSDIFSLGIVLYELLTGRRLFAGDSVATIYTQVVAFRELEDATLSDLHPRMQSVLKGALQGDPNRRTASAHAFETALTAVLGPEAPRARKLLAETMQKLFEDERAIEMTPIPSEISAAWTKDDSSPKTLVSELSPAPAPRARGKLAIAVAGVATVGALALAARSLGRVDVAPTPIVAVATSAPPVPIRTVTPGSTSVAEASPAAIATPVSTAHAGGTKLALATPAHTPAPVTAKGAGLLSVAARPWVQVFVDGKQVAKETPLRNFPLPSGRHKIRFENPGESFSLEKEFEIEKDGKLSLFVDVKAGTAIPR